MSLTIPPNKPAKKLKEFKTQWERTLATVAYLGTKLTDGETIFRKAKDNNPNTLFLRARPTLEKSKNISMTESDEIKLTKAMEDELIENYEYLIQIIDTAATIATRMIKEYSLEHLKMFQKILFNLESKKNYQEAIYMAKVVLDHQSERGNDFVFYQPFLGAFQID